MRDQPQKKDSFVLNIMVAAIEVLVSKGVKQSSAVRIGKEISSALCDRYGGCQYYLPNRYIERASETAANIYRDFDGRNYSELANKYNLSQRRIYLLLNKTDKAKTVSGLKRRKRGGGSPTISEALILLESMRSKAGEKDE